MRSRYLEAAARELTEASLYYESQRPGLGDEFLDEIRAAEAKALAMPETWAPLGDGVRRCLLRRFPYALLYHQPAPDLVETVAVMHLRRNPGYWKGRLG